MNDQSQEEHTPHTLTKREIADGMKMAIHELAHENPETLRSFLLAVFGHLADEASAWAGKKFFAVLAGSAFAFAVWLISKTGGVK